MISYLGSNQRVVLAALGDLEKDLGPGPHGVAAVIDRIWQQQRAKFGDADDPSTRAALVARVSRETGLPFWSFVLYIKKKKKKKKKRSRETGLPFWHSEFPKPYTGARQLGSVPTSDQTHLAYGRRASTALSILHSVFGTLRDVS